ncbi:uncharacterized protein P174DRAFT_509537 [Aspergillus novofumigatus IBT 16806]|uniref:Uncharacterized protein n=1 Tax=Aspergillus novofumigatus (strain IBT 16806) TaxID=1392255 RepID=A0A2I1CPX5_ASPN1|nr:uncharacterized protein P174DRAFT_509537 [Aspergillus novofumigatus IBT 16806]PKX99661.1 hypothetical protein P174DRAFT_509537 [Aspergillus novofumigatus IBT 16806]
MQRPAGVPRPHRANPRSAEYRERITRMQAARLFFPPHLFVYDHTVNGMKAVIRYILDESDWSERKSTHGATVLSSTPFERMTVTQWLRHTLFRGRWSGIATKAASWEEGIRAICATRPE